MSWRRSFPGRLGRKPVESTFLSETFLARVVFSGVSPGFAWASRVTFGSGSDGRFTGANRTGLRMADGRPRRSRAPPVFVWPMVGRGGHTGAGRRRRPPSPPAVTARRSGRTRVRQTGRRFRCVYRSAVSQKGNGNRWVREHTWRAYGRYTMHWRTTRDTRVSHGRRGKRFSWKRRVMNRPTNCGGISARVSSRWEGGNNEQTSRAPYAPTGRIKPSGTHSIVGLKCVSYGRRRTPRTVRSLKKHTFPIVRRRVFDNNDHRDAGCSRTISDDSCDQKKKKVYFYKTFNVKRWVFENIVTIHTRL